MEEYEDWEEAEAGEKMVEEDVVEVGEEEVGDMLRPRGDSINLVLPKIPGKSFWRRGRGLREIQDRYQVRLLCYELVDILSKPY